MCRPDVPRMFAQLVAIEYDERILSGHAVLAGHVSALRQFAVPKMNYKCVYKKRTSSFSMQCQHSSRDVGAMSHSHSCDSYLQPTVCVLYKTDAKWQLVFPIRSTQS